MPPRVTAPALPPRLVPGMTIGVVSPASGAKDPDALPRGAARLESLGYRVKPGRHAAGRLGYLAATDRERADDLHRMFADPKIDAIVCLRGGYGCLRLLPLLDFDAIRATPKILCGFSDITTLNLALLKHAGMVSFSGPMIGFTFAAKKPVTFAEAGFFRTLGGDGDPGAAPVAAGSVWQGHPEEKRGPRRFRVVNAGRATGPLTGGCLSLVAASIGTAHQPDTAGRIVFLEDIDEAPYGIDRMLTQMRLAGLFDKAAGVVFGRLTPHRDYRRNEKAHAAETGAVKPLTAKTAAARGPAHEHLMDEAIALAMAGLDIPIMTGLPFGHIPNHATLPFGVAATMDTRTGDLTIDEPAVR